MIPVADNLDFIGSERLPVIIWFTVPNCPPCRAIEPRVRKLIEKRGDAFRIFRFDVTVDPTIPQRLDIMSTPTFLFFKDGDEAGRLDGFPSVDDFEALLNRMEVKT